MLPLRWVITYSNKGNRYHNTLDYNDKRKIQADSHTWLSCGIRG